MNKLTMQTTNQVDENIKKIAELFPNCLTERLNEKGQPEAAIDFDMLRQELSKDIVEGPAERYQFTWPDKRNAIRLANAPTTDTLRPCREESVDFDNTQNLYIEGDNLEVLKLLRKPLPPQERCSLTKKQQKRYRMRNNLYILRLHS